MSLELSSFDEHMRAGQAAHQARGLDAAIENWRAAQVLAPDDLSLGRAVRGEASSTERRDGFAPHVVDLAERAANLHQGVLLATPDDYAAVREALESERVLGRIWLNGGIDHERAGQRGRGYLAHAGRVFQGGNVLADRVRTWGATDDQPQEEHLPDQHEINWWPYSSIAAALTGDRRTAREHARHAQRTARHAESSSLPTAAHISPEYAGKANRIARVRAVGARAVAELATPKPSVRRRAALWIASRIV